MNCLAWILVIRLIDPSGDVRSVKLECGLSLKACQEVVAVSRTRLPLGWRRLLTCEQRVPSLAREQET